MMEPVPSTAAVVDREKVRPPPAHFELRADERTDEGLRRIVLEQIDLASWHARRVAEADQHVHVVRQATKRVRAVLRLVRDGIGEEQYRHDNTLVRDTARDLSDARSAAVRAETLDDLNHWRAPLAPTTAELHVELVSDQTRTRARLGEGPLVDDLIGRLREVRTGVDGWTLAATAVPTTLGLRRTYRRGRRAMAGAYAAPRTHGFHEWRKRVKYLRHQIEVLCAVEPERMSTMAADLSELGDALGLHHDLTDLETGVRRSKALAASPAEQRDVLDDIAQRREELQNGMRPLADRLYAPIPRDFVRDVTTWWEAWRRAN